MSNADDSKFGKIKLVYCQNFVTHSECVMHPNLRLNIVIGPNGSGKSTLVSAIVLCLGGEPVTLCRSIDIRDFIKNGEKCAVIKVELYNRNGSTTLFCRSFDATGKNIFKINGQQVNKKNYIENAAKFNVQVTNLCQFLPQDRVQDFAKMNPQEIFVNTIKSVCDVEDLENFNKLRDMQKDRLGTKDLLEKNKESRKEISRRIEELKKNLDRYHTREQFLDLAKVCAAKRLWLLVDDLEKSANEVKGDLALAKKDLDEKRTTFKKDMQDERKMNERLEQLNGQNRARDLEVRTLNDNIKQVSRDLENTRKKIEEEKYNFEKDKREAEALQSEFANEARLLEASAQDVKNLQKKVEDENIREKINQVDGKMKQKKMEIDQLLTQRRTISNTLDEKYTAKIVMLKNRLEKLENTKELKLQAIRESIPDVYQAVQWLKDNRHLFEGHVFDPMILELNLKDPSYAKYFENTIQNRDLFAFTCENKNDVSKLTDELCVQRRLSINILYSAPAEECSFQSESIESLRRLGFTAYMLDLVEGPPPILNYICSIYNIHKLPVGTDQVRHYCDQVPKHIRQYYGGNIKFTSVISKYSKEISTMRVPIVEKKLLHSIDQNLVTHIKNDLNSLVRESDALKNKRSHTEGRIQELEHQYSELRHEKNSLDNILVSLKRSIEKVTKHKTRYASLKQHLNNSKSLETNFKRNVAKFVKEKLQKIEKRLELSESLAKALYNQKISVLRLNAFNTETSELKSRLELATSTIAEAEHRWETIKNKLKTCKDKQMAKTTEALKATNGQRPTHPNFSLREAFDSLPNSIEELNQQYEENRARSDMIGSVDMDDIQEYNRKQEELESIEASIANAEREDQQSESAQTSLYSKWSPKIINIVETINKNFSEFMTSMNYVGEISLARQNTFDFESYGIEIKVKYRENEPLQTLDRSRQSGGERAVAIAVYSLSMQHITHVPFRCVDEINQGMDARNERKICDMLVRETTKENVSQYFFVTPKLLPNLDYNEHVTVHIIYNSSKISKENPFLR